MVLIRVRPYWLAAGTYRALLISPAYRATACARRGLFVAGSVRRFRRYSDERGRGRRAHPHDCARFRARREPRVSARAEPRRSTEPSSCDARRLLAHGASGRTRSPLLPLPARRRRVGATSPQVPGGATRSTPGIFSCRRPSLAWQLLVMQRRMCRVAACEGR